MNEQTNPELSRQLGRVLESPRRCNGRTRSRRRIRLTLFVTRQAQWQNFLIDDRLQHVRRGQGNDADFFKRIEKTMHTFVVGDLQVGGLNSK